MPTAARARCKPYKQIVVTTDILTLSTTFSCVRWSEVRRQIIIQNVGLTPVEIGYGATSANPATVVSATLQIGQEWIEPEATATILAMWCRSVGGPGAVAIETLSGGL